MNMTRLLIGFMISVFIITVTASIFDDYNVPVRIGLKPNDGSGDPLRTAFNKVNSSLFWLKLIVSEIGVIISLLVYCMFDEKSKP
jgi:hypothetical protein